MLGAKERHWEKQAKARDKNNREKRCLPAAKQNASVTASPDSCGRLGLHQQKLPDCLGSLPSCTRPDLGQTPWMCKALADLIHQSSAAAGLLGTTVSSGLLHSFVTSVWSDLLGCSSQSESRSLYTSHPSHLSILIPQPS